MYVIQLFGAAKTAPDALYGKQKIRPGKTKKIVDVARLELATLLLHQAAEEAAAVCCFLQEIAGGGLMLRESVLPIKLHIPDDVFDLWIGLGFGVYMVELIGFDKGENVRLHVELDLFLDVCNAFTYAAAVR